MSQAGLQKLVVNFVVEHNLSAGVATQQLNFQAEIVELVQEWLLASGEVGAS